MCGRAAECKYTLPELDAISATALTLFLACQREWNYAGFGARSGIPIERVLMRAGILGIEVDELLMQKFDACVDEVMAFDRERSKSENDG